MAADGAQKMGLPMDVMLEIAGGTDPTTVDLRRNIGDPSSFRGGRLRLRRGERLLVGKWGNDLYIEDRASNLIATGCFRHEKEPCIPVPIAAHDGLILVRVYHDHQWHPGAHFPVDLRVCCPATGRVQSLPRDGPKLGQFGGGGGAVGRPFKVVNVASAEAGLMHRQRRHRFEFETFSSERGTWGPQAIIEERRRRLRPEMVEMLTCIKDWEAAESRLQQEVEDKELEEAFEGIDIDS
ncbi:hypothetical protein HU200_019934 [Digitaria exilis]|uniref:Uncharacterized protein n=1 Tax=Digitaria exilis TaxID=1010633 RepID=A0A835F100_9POAL|nr:hypothetical protein HU200_019934 [Digitaria exilis]